MGERVILVDDIDGTEGEVTKVFFSVNGSSYELDLNAKNVEKFHKAFAPYIEAGRPARMAQSTPGAVRRSTGTRQSNYDADAAKGAKLYFSEHPEKLPEGQKLPERGRISGVITDAWRELGSPTP